MLCRRLTDFCTVQVHRLEQIYRILLFIGCRYPAQLTVYQYTSFKHDRQFCNRAYLYREASFLLGGRGGEYVTFQQAQKEGGRVKKGEKSSMVVFWKWQTVEDEDTGEEKDVPFLRYFNVFHIAQCDGIAPKFRASEPQIITPAAANDAAEAVIHDYIAASGVKLISRESSEAFYRPSTDTVVLPLIKQFGDTAEYYSTAFHELTHSTGHPKRLNRITETARFGSASYSREELCAELGASFLLNRLSIETPGSFRNNAAYINHWLGVLKEDKRLLVSAAGQADKE